VTSWAAACGTADGFVAAYEELRSHVLIESRSEHHRDALLLIREGLAAWMTRDPGCAVTRVPPEDPAPPVVDAPAVFDEIHAGLVYGLASMALANRKEMSV
jgi:hypothetical protein